jgi:cell division septal protein FtsQ
MAPLLAGLTALFLVPIFQVRQLDVSGNQRLTTDQVVAAAGLQHAGSVFLVDPGGVERRLEGQTWVRSATVTAQLPDRVSIYVEEWRPAAVYRASSGPLWYVSAQAVVLGPADGQDASALLEIDGPAQPQPKAGRPALDRTLLVGLVNIQRALPGLIGQEVQSFAIDGCGSLTLAAKRGWRAQLGRVLTPEEFASLKDKMAALKSLAAGGDVNFDSPNLQYVNVMNPADVAVKERDKPARPGRGVSPAPAAGVQPVSPACS